MERANGGDLGNFVSCWPFTEDEVRVIFKQIVKAFAFIKKKGVVHDDIKPENILVNFPNAFPD